MINKEEISKKISNMITRNGSDKNIPLIFEERFVDKDYETTTLYFIGKGDFFEGTNIFTISITHPSDHPEARYASISVSPTMEDSEGNLLDYDWIDIYLPPSVVEKLLDLEIEHFLS